MVLFEMKNIKKSFGSLEVLKDISLQVEEGEVLSIIGPSGSGKSTLLRYLLKHAGNERIDKKTQDAAPSAGSADCLCPGRQQSLCI